MEEHFKYVSFENFPIVQRTFDLNNVCALNFLVKYLETYSLRKFSFIRSCSPRQLSPFSPHGKLFPSLLRNMVKATILSKIPFLPKTSSLKKLPKGFISSISSWKDQKNLRKGSILEPFG